MKEATAGIHHARRSYIVLAALVAGLALAPQVAAKPVPVASAAAAPSAGAPEPLGSAAPEEPSPWQQGPRKVELGHEITLDLASAYAFMPKEPAAKVLEANGSFYHDNLLGLVASADHGSDWFAVIRYDDEGYVKDDEEVDAEELLSSMREGNEQANEERKQRGFKPLTLDGWSDPPRYDKAQHHLVWALVVSDPDGKSVNYNTRILGRRGFVSLNLVTDPSQLAGFKHHAGALLAGTRFASGARYEDFDSTKDKVAEYGLAGLVMAGAGLGAAKLVKIGLLAKFWKLALMAVVAGKKFIVLALLALGALAKKLMSGKKDEPAT